MRRSPLALLPLVFAAAALAGCSSPAQAPDAASGAGGALDDPSSASAAPSETPAAPPAPLDACALLPQPEAEALAGTPLDPPVPGNPNEPSCSWTGPVEGPTAQVEIYASPGAKKFYEVDVDLQHTFTDVPGIGDEAHEEENAIFFRKGTTWVAIRLVLLNDPAENVPRIEEAARAVAGRL